MEPYDINQPDIGVVTKKNTGHYEIFTAGRHLVCVLSSRLRKELVYSTDRHGAPHRAVKKVKTLDHADPVAVGDWVRFVDKQNGTGMIMEVLPRRNQLDRQTAVPMPDALPFQQIIAANVDQAVPVFAAADPAPHWGMLDRYLVLAEARGLPAQICINKIDLADPEDTDLWEALDDYQRIGYPVHRVSATTGAGLDVFKQALQGRTSVFMGKSGVGKSSLLNAILPGLHIPVQAVSRVQGRGRHTTSHLEMYRLPEGGAIVDTPGTREFGLWDVDLENLDQYYPEMRPFIGQCRFGLDCQHDEEPGCAIRKAVINGQISPRRYASFMRLKVDP